MSRINPTTILSEGQAIGLAFDMLDQGVSNRAYQNITSGSSATATAAQIINGAYSFTSGVAAYALTTPTAAQIVAALANVEATSAFILTVHNGGTGTFTLTAGSGVTVTGLNTAATGTAKSWVFIVTNATAGAEAVVAVPMS